jgi:phosphopentomutase
MQRVIVIVIDSVGIGNAPDAEAYGDAGANTLVNMSRVVAGGLDVPALRDLGLGCILPGEIEGCPAVDEPQASYGRMVERSAGKDTTTGHWEMMGIVTEDPFPTYPDGFPQGLMEEWAATVGVDGWLHNGVASGTEIIRRLGQEHIRSGLPIVYTSADSVFQVAAHETHFGLERLYKICARTRTLVDPLRIGRVIARPFIGETPATFTRTPNRHDYSLEPPVPNAITLIGDAGQVVTGIGKISDIFAGVGIRHSIRTTSNREGMQQLAAQVTRGVSGFVFVNLVEFDMLYGHRRDPDGYARCLHEFDCDLAGLLPLLADDDVLIITADHGLDPTYRGTDHTREMVPVLAYQRSRSPGELGTRASFADTGATACAELKARAPAHGTAFW